MLIQVLVLGFLCVFGIGNCYDPDSDLEAAFGPRSHSIWDWAVSDLYGSESRKAEDRDVEEVTERDREPLSPTYKDPKTPKDEKPKDEKPGQKPERPYNPPGVVDVDANGFGFPQFADTFGFSSSFGNRHPSGDGGSLFGLGGFFGGPFAEHKPWWKGENVCIEREETTDDEDGNVQATQNDTDPERTPNLFATSISLSNCQQTSTKYECVTKINNHGVVKTFIVRYKCCYGFARVEGSPGCTKKVDLLPLLSTIDDVGSREFRSLIAASGLEKTFENENLTVLVPTDDALMTFNEQMEKFNQVDLAAVRRRRRADNNALSSKDMVLNHVIPGFVDISELINEEVVYSENNNSIRFNFYPTKNFGKLITANCARLRKSDNLATNGIVHVVEGVLGSIDQNVLGIIAEHPKLTSLNKALKSSDLIKNFKPNGHYTVFAPTDEAFNKLAESSKQKLLNGDACAATILKHHIVAHTVCSSAIIGNATTHNVDGEILNLQRTDEDQLLFENSAKIIETDIIGSNGVIHLIDVVVIPDSALYISQALKSENFTEFQKLIDGVGLAEVIDSMKNITLFAPSDSAFADPESEKLLEEIKDDKEKIKQLIMYHTVQGRLESCDMNNNMLLETKDNEKSIRLNLYSTVPVFTNIINRATVNCAPLTGFDEKTCGSVIHEVSKIIVPPSKNLLELLNSDENYDTFSELLKGTDLESILQDNTQSLTVLAPSDEVFAKLDASVLKSLKEDKTKASQLLKNHILTEILCCSGVGSRTWGFNSLVPTLSYQHHSVGKTGNRVQIGSSTVTRCDRVATNGVVHTISRVLFPQERRNPNFSLFLFDF